MSKIRYKSRRFFRFLLFFDFSEKKKILAKKSQMSSIVCHPIIKNGIATDARIKKQRPPPLVVARPRDLIQEACERLVLSDQQLRRIMVLMEKSMEQGLSGKKAAVKMLPTYVDAVPNGTEPISTIFFQKGDFLALDLGGTNFRVLHIKLEGKETKMTGKIFRVPESIMRGTGEALFDHIADCMAKFMEENNLKDATKLPLGFTFSFPCEQDGLTRGKLVTWTKGFKASGVEGADVVTLLRDACHRRKDIDIDVVALLNDTVGTLMACAFQENTCQIGVIVGTGTNACYMERLDRIPKLAGYVDEHNVTPEEMIINTEWGAFGDDGALSFLRTKWDDAVDRESINPGQHLYEKMISGMYMGECARVVLEDLAKQGLLFGGHSDAISTPHCFPTKFVSEIDSDLLEDDDRTFQKTYQILEDIGVEMITANDCANVAYVCSLISTRAAHLTAAGIAMLLNRINKKHVTVGVDGSVYRFHPTYPTLLDAKIAELIVGDIEYKLMLSEDGSGRGAALVAAVATRLKEEKLAAATASSER
ncbi:hypothetical protein B9Z55_000289 [Caenorhabditis nigoni]|uniref:Phosphotransferase n=1 Tax=Caenorhabditis nigoni TaxID=1611254 RepID=A0A2G5VMW9_9PELO|nr:hypothetical protein B9Z55_000289 [Caenorhabditis nigoni]